jgi:hypothetical protein
MARKGELSPVESREKCIVSKAGEPEAITTRTLGTYELQLSRNSTPLSWDPFSALVSQLSVGSAT